MIINSAPRYMYLTITRPRASAKAMHPRSPEVETVLANTGNYLLIRATRVSRILCNAPIFLPGKSLIVSDRLPYIHKRRVTHVSGSLRHVRARSYRAVHADVQPPLPCKTSEHLALEIRVRKHPGSARASIDAVIHPEYLAAVVIGEAAVHRFPDRELMHPKITGKIVQTRKFVHPVVRHMR